MPRPDMRRYKQRVGLRLLAGLYAEIPMTAHPVLFGSDDGAFDLHVSCYTRNSFTRTCQVLGMPKMSPGVMEVTRDISRAYGVTITVAWVPDVEELEVLDPAGEVAALEEWIERAMARKAELEQQLDGGE